MDTITTVFHSYNFDIREPEGKAAYEALRAKLEAMKPRQMNAMGSYYHPELDGRTVTLETRHLFDNQWNTAPIDGVSDKGLRVFDWAEEYLPAAYAGRGPVSDHLKRGHWLEQTDEMIAARRDTLKCGYCGKQEPAARGLVFCPHCLDSEYLKPADLKLTRLAPVAQDWAKNARPELTEAERADLMPRYTEAQVHGDTARRAAAIVKMRARVEREYTENVQKGQEMARRAAVRRDGFLWLLDHGINTDNVIYYDHTGRFGFGWRTPMAPEVVSALLDVISEFKYDYDIETADGKKLSS